MTDEAGIRQSMREWLTAASGKIRLDELTDYTPIIEERIISSLQVLDFICVIEQLSARPIEVDMLRPGVFRNIDTIYRTFFRPDNLDGSDDNQKPAENALPTETSATASQFDHA